MARASVSAESTFPATVSTPVAITRFGIISTPSHPAGPALRLHGRINDDGVVLATFDRGRIPLELVVEALRRAFGPIEYQVAVMPEAGDR
jgi:hypothetical protein